MRNKLWIHLALLLVIPGLLFTAGCAKKEIKSSGGMNSQAVQSQAQQTQEQQAAQKQQQEKIRQEQLKAQAAKQAAQEAQEQAEQERAAQRTAFESEDIHFAFDSDVLTPEAQTLLNKKVEWMKNNPMATVQVQGNCDERGTAAYNMALGERRANNAKKFMTDLGISASRIDTISFGKEKPLDPRHNEEAWAKNRRDHFVIR